MNQNNNESLASVEIKDAELKKEDEKPSVESNKTYIEIYMNTFMHAVNCHNDNCSLHKCDQLKRVIEHAKKCQKFKNGQCEFCRQLITLCIYHAKRCNEDICYVPLCKIIKMKIKLQKETNSSIDFVSTNLKLLRFKSDFSSQASAIGTVTGKRKLNNETGEEIIEKLEQNTDIQLKKQLFIEKLIKIREKSEPENSDILSKPTRFEIVKYFYNLCLDNSFLDKNLDTSNANFAALILRQELEINKATKNSEDYLYLITDYFYQVIKKLESLKKKTSIETQTDFTNDESKEMSSPSKRFKSE